MQLLCDILFIYCCYQVVFVDCAAANNCYCCIVMNIVTLFVDIIGVLFLCYCELSVDFLLLLVAIIAKFLGASLF